VTRLGAVAVGIALVACSKSAPKKQDPVPGPATDGAPAPVPVAADAAPAPSIDASQEPLTGGPIPSDTKLVITSVTADWDAVPTQLAVYRRDANGVWKRERSWLGVVGHTGLAWGKGLHGNGVPADQSGPAKIEGDGKAPAGVFSLDGSYGYGKAPPANTTLPYTQVDSSWKCVDDADSQRYNQIVDADQVAKDWKSAEEMKRRDALYTWVITVGHNPERMPGEGSCIFLHVWRTAAEGTVGCTAMDKADIEALLAELDPADRPVLVQLPAPLYDELTGAWQLPAR
jgi:D-alanyl-D-alanine dipeptidase